MILRMIELSSSSGLLALKKEVLYTFETSGITRPSSQLHIQVDDLLLCGNKLV